MEPGNTAKLPMIEPLAHNELTSPSPLSLSLHRNLSHTFPNEAQPYHRHKITTYSKVMYSLNTLLLSSTLVILKSMTSYSQTYPSKYTDHSPHIPPSCSHYLHYPTIYPLIRSYQQLNPHNTLLITCCTDHDPTASHISLLYTVVLIRVRIENELNSTSNIPFPSILICTRLQGFTYN